MASPPTGTLTFLFTDVEGSTKLWENNALAMQAALARHDELLRGAIKEHGGYVFKTVGDAFCCAFPTALDAKELYEECLALSRENSDSWWLANSLLGLALVSHNREDAEKATELYEESMNLFREQGTRRHLALCLNNLAMVVYSQGDLGRATKLTEEAVALFRELGTRGGVSLGLYNLGWMALLQDHLGKAAEIFRESLAPYGILG